MGAVEWKILGDVCKIMNGKDYKSFNEGTIPVYGSGGVMTYIDTFVYDKPSVLLPRKGSLNNVFYVDKPFWTVDTIYWTMIDERIIEPKYFFYYMKMQNLEKLNFAAGAVPSLTQSVLNKIIIPLPTLAEQKEIVSHLDTFTTLISSLESELEMRRKQYEHYRNQLLDFEGVDGVEWKTLGDLSHKITDGAHSSPKSASEGYFMPSVKDMTDNGFDFSDCKIISRDDYEYLKRNGCQPNVNDVLIAKDGSMLKYVFTLKDKLDIVLLSSIAIISPKLEIVIPEYLVCYLKQNTVRDIVIRDYSSKGGVPRIILKNFRKIIIPVPSKQKQQQIVEKLDAFEQLIQSLDTEIKLRKKQYEYYREKLLTFDKEEDKKL